MAVLRRILGMLATLLVSSFVIFGALHAAPGDPVTFLIGNPENVSAERIEAVRAQYHLDDPFLLQYVSWLGGAVRGDFGTSFQYSQTVSSLMAARLGNTLLLVAMATAVFVVGGVALGALSARRRGSLLDSASVGVTTVLASIPGFVVGIALVSVFSVGLGWFPVSGAGVGFLDRLWHLTLPALTLAAASFAIISRVTRQSMLEEVDAEHAQAARGFGLSERSILLRHGLRNAWGPIVTMIGLVVASLLAGTVVVETVFAVSGIGSLLVDSINQQDFPVVQAALLYLVVAYILVTTLIDLAMPLIDPRLRRRRTAGAAS